MSWRKPSTSSAFHWSTRAPISCKPAKFGDVVEIASRVTEFRRSSFDVEHRLTIGGELAVDGAETRVWAARDKNDPDKIHGVAIPGDVIARFG